MFIGHFGIGYLVKKQKQNIPLWVLFSSVQLMDLLAFIFVIVGIEKTVYVENANPFLRNFLELQYSHSLSGAFLLSVLTYFLFYKINKKDWALVLSLCVFSHWFIDFIMHPVGDITLFFGLYPVGLGLWNYPITTYVIEVILVIVGWIFLKRNIFSYILLIFMIGGFTRMIFSEEPLWMRENSTIRASLVLFFYCLYIYLAYLWDKKNSLSPVVT